MRPPLTFPYQSCKNIIARLIDRINATFVTRVHTFDTDGVKHKSVTTEDLPINDIASPFENLMDELFGTGFYYPDLPVVRKLRNYISTTSGNVECRKKAQSFGKLGDGTFLMFCLDCRQCLGFHIMSEAEGPRTVRLFWFTLFSGSGANEHWLTRPKYWTLC